MRAISLKDAKSRTPRSENHEPTHAACPLECERAGPALSFELDGSPTGTDPALDDVDGWLHRVKEGDVYIRKLVGDLKLPVEVQDAHIAGVHTFVIRANNVPDDSSTPIYLDIHGGALIMGGGEVCRLMGSANAMSTGMIHWAVDYRMHPHHPYPAALDDCIVV